MSINTDKQGLTQYSEYYAIEVAILQQEIELPKVTDYKKFPLTFKVLEKHFQTKPYKLKEHYYGNTLGNFYIPIVMPLIENGESTELEFDAPETKNVLNDTLETKPYIENNFLQLMIPKYIVMNFEEKIPEGTKFLVGFVGGSESTYNMSIIGLYGDSLEADMEADGEDGEGEEGDDGGEWVDPHAGESSH